MRYIPRHDHGMKILLLHRHQEARTTMGPQRWLFWIYLALAIPTLLAMFVVQVHGDTNVWFWLFGILMLILSLPWLLVMTGTANIPLIGVAIVGNAILLWWVTRQKASRSETNSGAQNGYENPP
jgi:Flp pilus assembly protein TadB